MPLLSISSCDDTTRGDGGNSIISRSTTNRSQPATRDARQRTTSGDHQSEDDDITHTPTSESTGAVRSLLVGTSIIKNVEESKLKNTKVICPRGGHISDTRASLARLPSGTHYDRTVIVVGGNDCADESDANEVVEMYRELVQQVKRISTSITVSSRCPRNKTVELTQTIYAVNAGLQSLCSDESLTFINNDPAFHLADGTINDGHLLHAGIHLTHKATGRLAKNLNLVLERPEKGVSKQNTTQTGKPAAAPLNVKTTATHDAMNVSAAFRKREKARQPIARQAPTPRRETTGNQHQHQRRQQSRNDYRSYSNDYRHEHEQYTADDDNVYRHGEHSNWPCNNCGEINYNTQRCRHSYRLTCNECGMLGHKSKHHDY